MTWRTLCIVGTRPEAIKIAPVVVALRADPRFAVRLVSTGQHREMLDGALAQFGLTPDADLGLLRPGQTLSELTGKAIAALGREISAHGPSAVLGQGDTTTAFAAALAAFQMRVPFAHVEAGLRTGDLASPFPEEMNRVLVGRIAKWHFAPTEAAARTLLAEGCDRDCVVLTGNTVIDALLASAKGDAAPLAEQSGTGRTLLVTLHRRENFGAPLESILDALSAILAANPDVRLTIPVHPNPNASGPIRARFTGHARVSLTPPLGYREFVAAMRRAVLILTDSGGVQEEAPALGRPVLVLREKTERPEAIAAGVAALVGTTATGISSAAQHLLDDPEAYGRMASGGSPYGDGRASARIVSALAAGLSGQNARLAGEAAVPWRCGPWPPPPTTVAEDREPQGDRRAA